MTFAWDPTYEIGVPEIDSQHRELFACCDQLLAAMREAHGRDEAGEALSFLERYVAEHFADEERLMELAGYPSLELHRLQHRSFVAALRELRAQLQRRGPSAALAIELSGRVRGWVLRHVLVHDRAMGEFLREARDREVA